MDEKELKQKWNELGYECTRFDDNYLFLKCKNRHEDIKFRNEFKEMMISSNVFSAFFIPIEVINLIHETVEWLGWNK